MESETHQYFINMKYAEDTLYRYVLTEIGKFYKRLFYKSLAKKKDKFQKIISNFVHFTIRKEIKKKCKLNNVNLYIPC